MEKSSLGAHETRSQKDWRDAAACRQARPDLFFPDKGGSVKNAKKFCTDCLVRVRCLDTALALPSGEDFGVWGGMTKDERTKERARRRRLAAGADDAAA